MSRTIWVTGSRSWRNLGVVRRELRRLRDEHGALYVVQRAAPGAEQLAFRITKELGQIPWTFETPTPFKQIIAKAQPQEVLAFATNLSRSGEAADIVRVARDAGIPVRIVGERSE